MIEHPDEDAVHFDLNEASIQTGIDVSFVYDLLLEAVFDLRLQENETVPGPTDQPPPIDGLVTTDCQEILQKIRLIWWTGIEIVVMVSKLVYQFGKTMKNILIHSIRKQENAGQ